MQPIHDEYVPIFKKKLTFTQNRLNSPSSFIKLYTGFFMTIGLTFLYLQGIL